VGLEHALDLQLAVGADHGVRVDGKIDGQLAHRRQLIARHKVATGDPELHLLDDLPVKRYPALGVDPNLQAHVSRLSSPGPVIPVI
jgi:hypothetical protein